MYENKIVKVYNVAYDKVKFWCGLFTDLYFPSIIVQRLGAREAAGELPTWTLKGGIISRSFTRDRFALPPLTMKKTAIERLVLVGI